jgi:hypothetical protein
MPFFLRLIISLVSGFLVGDFVNGRFAAFLINNSIPSSSANITLPLTYLYFSAICTLIFMCLLPAKKLCYDKKIFHNVLLPGYNLFLIEGTILVIIAVGFLIAGLYYNFLFTLLPFIGWGYIIAAFIFNRAIRNSSFVLFEKVIEDFAINNWDRESLLSDFSKADSKGKQGFRFTDIEYWTVTFVERELPFGLSKDNVTNSFWQGVLDLEAEDIFLIKMASRQVEPKPFLLFQPIDRQGYMGFNIKFVKSSNSIKIQIREVIFDRKNGFIHGNSGQDYFATERDKEYDLFLARILNVFDKSMSIQPSTKNSEEVTRGATNNSYEEAKRRAEEIKLKKQSQSK